MICKICGCEMKNNGDWFACPTCGSVHFGPDTDENKRVEKPVIKPVEVKEEPIKKQELFDESIMFLIKELEDQFDEKIKPEPKEEITADFKENIKEDIEETPVKENHFTSNEIPSTEVSAPIVNNTVDMIEEKPPKQVEVAVPEEVVTETLTENAPENESIPEPVVEPEAEPEAELEAEPVVEPIAEPVVEPVVEPEVEAVVAEAENEVHVETEDENEEADEEDEDSDEEEQENGKKKNKLKDIVDFMLPIIAAVVIAFVLKTFIIANAKVPTGSMVATININDRIIASRLAYKTGIPSRYDIVLFYYPDDENDIFVKRILGLPGETLSVVDGVTYVTTQSGKTIQTDQSFVNPEETPSGNYGPYYIPVRGETITVEGDYCFAENGMVVGNKNFIEKYCVKNDKGNYVIEEDLYFMMGDNRNWSKDSREWDFPYVAESKIIGKVLFKYYPSFEKID